MNIVDGKFTVVAFTNKYGFYGCIRTPVDKEKTDYYRKYFNIRVNDRILARNIKNGDLIEIIDGWFSVWNDQLYLNINEGKISDNIKKDRKNGNETRKR